MVGRAEVMKNSTDTEISVFVFVSAKNVYRSYGMPRKIARRAPPFAKFAPSVSELGGMLLREVFTRIDIILIIINAK